jgi:hypothetical protein
MPGDDTTGAEIVKRTASHPVSLQRVDLMSDDEIRRAWRLASALAASGMSTNARQAEQAFGKILIGRDLGISPTRAMQGIDFVNGNVQMRGVLLLAFVRESQAYDYEIVELDGETEVASKDLGERESKQRATLRFLKLLPDGSAKAMHPDITFTMAMARKQGNVKEGSAWMTARRNMLLWRAASDGVKMHCPELLGGIPVYVEGELDGVREPAGSLDAGQGDGQAQGLDMGPDVEAVIALAEEKGHAALSDRAAIEMQLGSQAPGYVAAWVKAARKELDAIPQDAEVVEAREGHESPEAAQTPERTSEADAASEAPAQPCEPVDPAEALAALRRRGTELLDAAQAAADAGRGEEADAHYAELAAVEANIEAMSNTDQGTLI